MAAEEGDTERARVQTYVPAYQKEAWEQAADDLDMTLSEFVRSMVQAGRSDLDLAVPAGGSGESADSATPSSASNPQGESVEDRVARVLSDGGYCDWDELLEALTADIEDQLEDALQSMQEANDVRYSGRDGGYTLS